MTIGATSRVSLACDGVTKVFPVAIQAYAATDLTVILTAPASAGGAQTTLTLNSDYTMAASGTLSPTAWTLTTLPAAAYATGYTLQVFENPVQTQQTQFVQGQPFPSLAVQTAFDRLTQMVHRLQDQVSRAIRAPDGDVLPTMLLPFAAARANLGIVFDALGNAVLGAISATVLTGANILGLIFDLGYRYRIHPAESLAGLVNGNLTFGFDPYDLRRYGADPTGVAVSDTALVNVLLVCGTAGGTIRCPGRFAFASQYSLSQRHSIVFQGDGGPTSSNTNGTVLIYTGTASPWFSCPNASGVLFKNMTLSHSNAGFTGTYIKYGAVATAPAAFCGLDDVAMGSSVSNTTHLDLDATITFSAKRCLFQFGANPSIKGQSSVGGSYSNVVTFRDCEWTGCANTPIAWGGFSWTFDGCVFENLQNGTLGAFLSTAATPCQGLSFRGCWAGDSTVGGGTLITFVGQGLSIVGNWLAGNAGSNCVSLQNASGVEIVGNYIAAWNVVLGFDVAPITAVVFQGNYMSGITSVFGTTANTPANLVFNPNFVSNIASPLAPPSQIGVNAANGWSTDVNGVIEQWGVATVTAGTPLAIVFTKTFPTAIWNAQVSLITPAASQTTASATSLASAGMTLNILGGSAAGTVHWRVKGN